MSNLCRNKKPKKRPENELKKLPKKRRRPKRKPCAKRICVRGRTAVFSRGGIRKPVSVSVLRDAVLMGTCLIRGVVRVWRRSRSVIGRRSARFSSNGTKNRANADASKSNATKDTSTIASYALAESRKSSAKALNAAISSKSSTKKPAPASAGP